MDIYGTHIPLLAAAIRLTEDTCGPVLEMGSGDYSTPLLHELCRGNRELLTADCDPTWITRYNDLFNDTWHKKYLVKVTDNFLATGTFDQASSDAWDIGILNRQWDVVFVDHRPGERRRVDLFKYANLARVVVVHDTEEAGYNYTDAINAYRYKFHYDRWRPHTTILSNTINVEVALSNVIKAPERPKQCWMPESYKTPAVNTGSQMLEIRDGYPPGYPYDQKGEGASAESITTGAKQDA